MVRRKETKLNRLRSKHKALVYEKFDVVIERNLLILKFSFSLGPSYKIRNEVIFPDIHIERYHKIKGPELENIFFHLGLGEMMLMWRFACPQNIVVKAGKINKKQLRFWKKLFTKGFGEFYFRESINFRTKNFLSFRIFNKSKQQKPFKEALLDRDLLLTTGGKDSAVTIDILHKSTRKVACLLLDPQQSALQACKKVGVRTIKLARKEDIRLPNLQQQYFNGHTPWIAYLSLLSTTASVLYNYKNIIVSNEESSDENNAIYLGMPINHQYSKTTEYENDFRNYLTQYLSHTTNYFSFLKPLKELQICRLFANMEQYHNTFRSCNVGMAAGSWCLSCAKCLSIYLTLYPFMGKKLHPIFGKRFLDNFDLLPILYGLMNVGGYVKPFECVATISEIKAAVFMCRQKAAIENETPFRLLETVVEYEESNISCLNYWNNNNNLPSYHKKVLKDAYNKLSSNSYLEPTDPLGFLKIFRSLW